jgi:iron complex outermembrane receptor protein
MPESLATVPMAIDVVGAERLGSGAFDGLVSLAAGSPGMYYESMWGGLNSAIVLRGQSQPSAAGDNVGVFVDGVYQASRSAIDADLLDVERIEVARGPQSTLFGHSTFAGAVHFVTHRPTQDAETGATLQAGSDGYLAASGFLSGPLAGRGYLARLALGVGQFDGTGRNEAAPAQGVGGWRRQAAALSVTTGNSYAWKAELSARLMKRDQSAPLSSVLAYADYNCGGQDAVSGAWSYYCGQFPKRSAFDVSPGTPESDERTWQVALRVQVPLGTVSLESFTSYFDSAAELYRDFDGSSAGDWFGVCTVSVNCSGLLGPPRFVSRLLRVNEVSAQSPEVQEWLQDLRLQGSTASSLDWMAGLTGFMARSVDQSAIGADGSALAPTERLTAYLPGTPLQVGPLSAFNQALVQDPNARQVEQALTRTERRTLAAYGSVEREVATRVRARAELRVTTERTWIDSVTANFQPSFGKAIAPQTFTDVTPRFSVDYRGDASMAYLSAAKGSRSGGVNPIPGLLPGEQGYEPEENWTYELGARYLPIDRRVTASTTLFYVDWKNVQLSGFSSTPGVGNLITRNARGSTTRGVETSLTAAMGSAWRIDLGAAFVDPRFRAGTDDPGDSRFCGLSAASSNSTFCVVGPPRTSASGSVAVVPYVDGNRLNRAPGTSWRVGLSYAGKVLDGFALTAQLNVNGQSDVFDRAIGGARFGARVLTDARVVLSRGSLSVEVWGLNLFDEDYVATAASRGAVFYPTTPRPLDLLYGSGRRLGVTLRYRG